VSWSYQRPGRDLVLVAHEKCGHGYCSGQCPPQVHYVVIKILDKITGGGICKWTSHMLLSQCLEESIEGYTEKPNWPI
jgi:hypothetical protein